MSESLGLGSSATMTPDPGLVSKGKRGTKLLRNAAIIVVAVTCCAGCGSADNQASTRATAVIGNPSDPYLARMREIGQRFEQAVRGLYPLASGTEGSAQREAAIGKLANAQEKISDVDVNLEKIHPPARVRRLHRRLRIAVDGVQSEVSRMLTALQHNDMTTFISLSGLKALQTVNSTTALMKKNGYDITSGEATGGPTTAHHAPASGTPLPARESRQSASREYVDRMKVVGNQFESAVRGLYPLATGTSGSPQRHAAVVKLVRINATLDKVETSLRQLTAPEAIRSLHTRLVAAVGNVQVEVKELTTALRQNRLAAFFTASRLSGLDGVNKITASIQKEGYGIAW
jgi:hypothetical protein